ncbi:hypothetical protein EG329_004736 [Mollisiaceae sp. DMI_Dod_QoI]|nr:hypothetical protein EG329_004736 [Helotiales sp. DMI_Dod_QoI]
MKIQAPITLLKPNSRDDKQSPLPTGHTSEQQHLGTYSIRQRCRYVIHKAARLKSGPDLKEYYNGKKADDARRQPQHQTQEYLKGLPAPRTTNKLK